MTKNASALRALRRYSLASTCVLMLGAAWSVACGSGTKAESAPLRSPTRDYQPPAPRAADGRVIGADEISPSDRIEQGARVGSDNQPGPGWEVDEKGVRYDPKKRVGGAVDPPPTEQR